MPRYSISYPCKVVTPQLLNSFSTVVVAASKEDSEIIVGVQDFDNSDLNVVDFLSEQPYTRIVDSSTSINLSGTLNKIISSSQGRYLIRTDNDDFMHPLRIKNVNNAIDSLVSFSILGQAYRCFRGRKLGPLIISATDSIENKLQLLLGVPFAHPAITLDLTKIGKDPYDETQTYAQDYMLYVDKINSGKYIGSSAMATYYNTPLVNNNKQTNKRKEQLADHEKAMLKLWRKINPTSITIDEIHMLRCTLVTNENSLANQYLNRDEATKRHSKARHLLKKMLKSNILF